MQDVSGGDNLNFFNVSFFRKLYDLCFPLPSVCPVCMKQQPELQVCDSCRAEALRKRTLNGQCQRCRSFGLYSEQCRSCREWPDYLAGNIAIWPHQDGWQQAILDFKFRNMPWLADALAAELAPFLPDGYDLLVPVPLHPKRQRERGYNQSELLAKALSEKTGIPWQNSLRRVRYTPHQTGMSREQRLKNLDGAFALRPGGNVQGKRVILVDDVFTTGTTIRHCAEILHKNGAARILGATLASGQGRF